MYHGTQISQINVSNDVPPTLPLRDGDIISPYFKETMNFVFFFGYSQCLLAY